MVAVLASTWSVMLSTTVCIHLADRHLVSNRTESGISKPAMIRRVVDLPVPEPPMMPTASPLRMVMFAPRRIALLPNDL